MKCFPQRRSLAPAPLLLAALLLTACPQPELLCGAGQTACDGACVDLTSDPKSCGACGVSCGAGALCEAGACVSCEGVGCGYDVVAACYSVGQVVGVSASLDVKGPSVAVGAGPQALGVLDGTLLVADGVDQQLRQVSLERYEAVGAPVALGASPNHVLTHGRYVYVVTSVGNTLLVLRDDSQDAGVAALTPVKELNLGDNTSPQAIARVGNHLYVPLYGGFGAGASAGQKVVKLDVSNPENPEELVRIDLPSPSSFDAGVALPRPYSATVWRNKVYVALNNLDPGYAPAGPGHVAELDPAANDQVRLIPLPEGMCLNAGWTQPSADGEVLFISCAGATQYDSNYQAISTERTGLLALSSNDELVGSWSAGCPPGVGADAGCLPPSIGRFAVVGNRLYAGDQTGGRLFVVERVGNSLVERRGYQDGGAPIQACALDETSGVSNVYDVIAVQ